MAFTENVTVLLCEQCEY